MNLSLFFLSALSLLPACTTEHAAPAAPVVGAPVVGAPAPAPPGGHPIIGNPASSYCAGLGYAIDGEDCVLPGGARCGQWAFLRGQCGQASSWCAQQGGAITTVEEAQGSAQMIYGRCTLPSGAVCQELEFFASGVCGGK